MNRAYIDIEHLYIKFRKTNAKGNHEHRDPNIRTVDACSILLSPNGHPVPKS